MVINPQTRPENAAPNAGRTGYMLGKESLTDTWRNDEMALVMVHLLVARDWAARHPQYLESPEYYYGAIAPDAIHVRDGNDKSHKDAIHYGNWRGSHPEQMRAYWLERHTDFDVGYAIHCLTDGIWVDGYKATCPGILLPNGCSNPTLYYNDVYATERMLFRDTPDVAHLFDMIARAETPEDHPQLSSADFRAWRRNVLREYDVAHPAIGAWRARSAAEQGLPEPMNGDPIYITPEYIERFLRTTCDQIETIIRRYEQ